MPAGVQLWYYTKSVPSRAVAVAEVSVPPMTPAQLTSINNTIYAQGPLSVWKTSTGYANPADFTAPDYNQSIAISGSSAYFISNQFFELSNVAALDGTPLYYQHVLPVGVADVTVLDLDGNVVTTSSLMVNSTFYHSLDGAPYYVRYITPSGYLTTALLQYTPVMAASQATASGQKYQITGRLLTIGVTSAIWIRFRTPNGFQVMPMYDYLPNTPWYPRIRFGIQPPPADWGNQRFILPGGILQGNFVPGTVLSTNLIEFERKFMYYDPKHLPDILVYDKNNVIKYALDGSQPTAPPRRGTLFNWKRSQIKSIDPASARVEVTIDLDPTDIVYAFYNYYEPDVVYTALDVNPFTNPAIKNSIVQFYAKFDGQNPFQNVYHQVLDVHGVPIAGATNDPAPGTGTTHYFATLVVGAAVSSVEFSYKDVRVRGGGLAPQFQSIPQADSFFDLGYWDGKPYPIGGALAVYLPLSILNSMSRSEVQGKVASTIPMGALPVIRYFDEQGQEYV